MYRFPRSAATPVVRYHASEDTEGSLQGDLLTVNAGSSTLKLALYANDDTLERRGSASIERVGDFRAALDTGLVRLGAQRGLVLAAAGHRVVHGGESFDAPVRITPEVIARLQHLAAIDPMHMPQALALIDGVARRHPELPQVACFDTTFHRTMPPVAQRYPLAREAWDAGVRRYGFHGLSCESILAALRRIDAHAADGRVLIAHLGNGASLTALRGAASVDTTMGFSPSGGLMMGTRSGDLDPGVLTYYARSGRGTPEALERLVTREAGLLGVSAASADMRDLLARDDRASREAVDLFCYIAAKHAGALAAVLNGLDTLVFTGGIGEHAAPVRARICGPLRHLDVELDETANAGSAAVISRASSRVTVRVMQTDEDLVIARHTRRVLFLR